MGDSASSAFRSVPFERRFQCALERRVERVVIVIVIIIIVIIIITIHRDRHHHHSSLNIIIHLRAVVALMIHSFLFARARAFRHSTPEPPMFPPSRARSRARLLRRHHPMFPRACPSFIPRARAPSALRDRRASRRRRPATRASASDDDDDDVFALASIVECGSSTNTRALAASRDLAPGTTVFSFPFRFALAVYVDDDDEDDDDDDGNDDGNDDDAPTTSGVNDAHAMSWSGKLALDVVRARIDGRARNELARARSSFERARALWLATLPFASASCAALDFTEHELAMCEDERITREARDVRRRAAEDEIKARATFELAGVEFASSDFAQALRLVYTRAFARKELDGRTMKWLCPFVDMCNHSFASVNAHARVATGTRHAQGRDATADVADVMDDDVDDVEDKYVRLIIDDDGEGVREGEEICISYGAYPNDVFLLYFGFVPRANAHDRVVLFDTVSELFAFIDDDCELKTQRARMRGELAGEDEDEDDANALDAASALVNRRGGGFRFLALSITIDGVDETLIEICRDVLRVDVMDVVRKRARQILTSGRFSTTIADDIAALERTDDDLSPNARMAIEYRLHKKEILIAPLGQTLERYRPHTGV